MLDWRAFAIQEHFARRHGKVLTPAEAHRMITSRLTDIDVPLNDEWHRDFRTVSGGLPSLPARRTLRRHF